MSLDLREIQWVRNRGYDVDRLTNLLTANDAWVNQVIARLDERLEDIRTVRSYLKDENLPGCLS